MKRKLFSFIILASIVQLGFVSGAFPQDERLPGYTGYVNDYAGILSYDTKSKLSLLIGELERKTTAQIAVVTVGTTSPSDIESYAVRLFEKWGIGQKGKDNGVLLLIALNDRKMRIEVGYGLEGAIPDALANIIIQDYIISSFKEGDFDTGVAKGTIGLVKLIAKEYDVELSETDGLPIDVPIPEKPTLLASIINFIFTVFIIIMFLSLRLGFFWWFLLIPGLHRRRGGYWYGGGFGGNSGGFGGSFGGFGGGLSGGGGASGSW
jgi:uncharacterized protein